MYLTCGVVGLWRRKARFCGMARAQGPVARATLDRDAMLIKTQKALYCYKRAEAYQPFNTWWTEQGLIVP